MGRATPLCKQRMDIQIAFMHSRCLKAVSLNDALCVSETLSDLYGTAMGHGCDVDVSRQRAAEVHMPYTKGGA